MKAGKHTRNKNGIKKAKTDRGNRKWMKITEKNGKNR